MICSIRFPPTSPAGENLQYAPIFDKIKEARREDDDVPQGDWARGRKLADWPLTIKLINETLSTKTKDLQLTAWLAEAMLKREGISGLREVLDLNRAYSRTSGILSTRNWKMATRSFARASCNGSATSWSRRSSRCR